MGNLLYIEICPPLSPHFENQKWGERIAMPLWGTGAALAMTKSEIASGWKSTSPRNDKLNS
jgi:hypothetical protein